MKRELLGGGRDQLYQVVLNLISQLLLCPQLLFPSPVRQELQCPLPRGVMKMKSCSGIISTLRALTKREFLFVGEFMHIIMII